MSTNGGNGSGPASSSDGALRAAKRYGPFVVAALVVIAAIAVFGGGGGDDDGDTSGDGDNVAEFAETSREELVRSGPMTPERAELEGRDDVDFGPNCDTETGRIRLPTIYAAPCVEPFEGDNGGATNPGVTGDTVKIVAYQTDPALDPIGAAMFEGMGANLDPNAGQNTMTDYLALYQSVYETYGRTVELEFYTGTGSSEDKEAAIADAIAIADMEPFAVIGSPLQAREVFAEAMASQGIICAPGCGLALTDELIEQYFPYIWTAGPTATQGAKLAADAIGSLAGPGKAALAGDDETRARDRTYGLVHYDTPDGDQESTFRTLVDELGAHDITIETDIEYFLDPARMQENARSVIAQLQEADVTTVIFMGDGLTPGALTAEATAQDFKPEWILGPNVLGDVAVVARTYDQDQWQNGFGLAFAGTPGADEIGDSFMIYDWAYDRDPPSNIYAILEPPVRTIFTAIQLAGPELTPESFRDALFRTRPTGGGPTRPLIGFGDDERWDGFDLGSSDDVTLIWWDPAAQGEDELGIMGSGLYRFARGGQRYGIGDFPSSPEDAGLFDNETGVIELTELPSEDRPPDYPRPQL